MSEPNYKDILSQVSTSVFRDLLKSGYKNKGVSEISNDRLIGTYYVATLSNDAISRAIEITLIPRNSNKSTNDVVTIHIDNFCNDTFSLSNFCSYKNIESTEKDLSLYQGSFTYRLRSCLQQSYEVLMDNLTEVIEGKKWEHIPFDWGEYKWATKNV